MAAHAVLSLCLIVLLFVLQCQFYAEITATERAAKERVQLSGALITISHASLASHQSMACSRSAIWYLWYTEEDVDGMRLEETEER